MKKIWVLVSIVIFTTGMKAKAHFDVQCSANQLDSFDCHLKLKPYQIQFRKEKIHLNNDTWKKLYPFPIVGKGVEWKMIALRKLGRRYFVEMLVWGPPEGEAGVQSLRWVVQEAVKEELKPKLDYVVQKRQKNREEKGGPFYYDKKENFLLSTNEKGQIFWYAGKRSGGL